MTLGIAASRGRPNTSVTSRHLAAQVCRDGCFHQFGVAAQGGQDFPFRTTALQLPEQLVDLQALAADFNQALVARQ